MQILLPFDFRINLFLNNPVLEEMGMSKWADLVDTLDVKCLDSYEFIFSPFHDNLLNGTNNDIIFNLNPKIISLDKQKCYIYDRSWIISFFELE